MTDRELIKALRDCEKMSCADCPMILEPDSCHNTAVNRLEALLAEVEKLKAQVPKWVSVEERLPETEPETVIWKDPDEGITSEVSALVLVVDRKGEMWVARYESGPIFQGWVRKSGRTVGGVTRWMPLPSTEGVE